MISKPYLSIFSVVVLLLFSSLTTAQTISQPLPEFDKVQISPMINLVLEKGGNEHIRIEYRGIDPEKINYSVKGKKLSIYLDDAKYTVKTEEIIKDGYRQKVPIYRGAEIMAYVTYKSLENLQLRGEERAICKDSLMSKKFKIRLFGESNVDLAFVQADRLKMQAFGENEVIIRAGKSTVQKYRLFGENKIHTAGMSVGRISTSTFGESDLNIYASERIRVWGLGELKMLYSGQPYLKRFVLGASSINKN